LITSIITEFFRGRIARPLCRDTFEAEAVPHLRKLYAASMRLTGNTHDAEDLVQETCLRAFRSFDRYTPGTDIRAWLFTILYRAHTDVLRRAARRLKTVSLLVEPASRSAAAWVDGRDLADMLARLPAAFRDAVVLRDVEGFSYDEIAAILDIPAGTVMSRIHRGRALLRAALTANTPPEPAAAQPLSVNA
jgi:RNA polymerase sigma-70 factor (ECF subfamily)